MHSAISSHVEVLQGLPVQALPPDGLLHRLPDDLFLSIGGQAKVGEELELFSPTYSGSYVASLMRLIWTRAGISGGETDVFA